MTLSEHFNDQPFPTLDFASSSRSQSLRYVNMWLRALDKRGMTFHFDDPTDAIIKGGPDDNGERLFTDEQAACIDRCVKRLWELLGDSCDPFQYASDVVGGGWALPVHDLEPEDLEGATITRYVATTGFDGSIDAEAWPQFKIILANGERAYLTIARDPELNGPGYALIERAE